MQGFVMMLMGRRRFAELALGVMLSVFASSAALAQLGAGPVGTNGNIAGRRNPVEEKPALPAPSAIPGAKARGPVAPASRPVGDMRPTDALFDAINRGDIAAARDALNRGADLNGINVLGMTPMELSVDLGRNDISFLLLSMRGEDSGRGSRAVSHDAVAPEPAAKPTRTAKRVKPPKSVQAAKAGEVAPPVAPAKLFANDGGGAPLPNAGFLGFDQRPAVNQNLLR